MVEDSEFIDYYALLQVSFDCDQAILEKAYRHFAQIYHPDHPETANLDRFHAVIEGYGVLKDPEKRSHYDRQHRRKRIESLDQFPTNDEVQVGEDSAIIDADTHMKVLRFLYKRRRENSSDPGVVAYYVQKMLGCSYESFEFHLWYLKSKGYIVKSEQSELEITIEGVDHVISQSKSAEAAKLLSSSQSSSAASQSAT